jgi:hypothetical protein
VPFHHPISWAVRRIFQLMHLQWSEPSCLL